MKMNDTVRGLCAITMGCVAMALELTALVIHVPANIAEWLACKLMNGAEKLYNGKVDTARLDNGKRIIHEVADM